MRDFWGRTRVFTVSSVALVLTAMVSAAAQAALSIEPPDSAQVTPAALAANAAEDLRTLRGKVRQEQRRVTKGSMLVKLDPKPVDLVFQSPDVPFPVALWLCDSTPRWSRAARADCGDRLDEAIARNDVVTFNYTPNEPAAPERVMLRVVGGRLPPTALAKNSTALIRLDLLNQNAVNGQVAILVVDEADPMGDPLAAISLSFEDVLQLPLVNPRNTPTRRQVSVVLDRTGVVSRPFLNPRWPVFLGSESFEPVEQAKWQSGTDLVFDNRVADRAFVVTFSGIPSRLQLTFLAANVRLVNCGNGDCDAVLVVPPGSRAEQFVPLKLLRDAYVGDDFRARVESFTVELFHGDAQLANPRGFFSLVPAHQLDEAPNGSKWQVVASVQSLVGPDLSDLQPSPDAEPEITAASPRGGGTDHTLGGTMRVGLKQSLSTWANGEFDLRLKKGAFGTKSSVMATKYRLNLFGQKGGTYSAGLFDIAEPSEAIAISESGETLGWHSGAVDVNYILRKYVPRHRRDVLDFGDTEVERGHSAALVQVKNVDWLRWNHLQVDLYAVVGRKSVTRCLDLIDGGCPERPPSGSSSLLDAAGAPATHRLRQQYTTVGTDLTFAFKEGWFGSAALYRSHLRVIGGPPDRDVLPDDTGSGTVGLGTIGWTKFGVAVAPSTRPARFTMRAQVGWGSGDASQDDDRNEGYLGETAGFAPDDIFLAVLAPAISVTGGQVGTGLTNKSYAGLLLSTPRWSPWQYLGNVPGFGPLQGAARSTTLQFHEYRFNERVNDSRRAGREVSLDFSLESDTGITYSLRAAGFWPGAALRWTATGGGLVRGVQWRAAAQVSVKM